MLQILPNWHPIFVHFTIALLSMSVLFFVIQAFLSEKHRWQTNLSTLAKANLWIGIGFALVTALAGWFAYNSVNHDTPSHLAMTKHRNIALTTLGVFIILTLWSLFIRIKGKPPLLFSLAMLIAGGLLTITGWLGAESVYRYGLGVMSMPQSSGEGHAHQHIEGEGHSPTSSTPAKQIPTIQENSPHQHDTENTTQTNHSNEVTHQSSGQNAHDSTPHTH